MSIRNTTILPLNSRAEFNDWLHFHNGGNDPAIHLGTQEMILDGTLPKEWAEEMKATLRRRANYREVRQAAAFLMRVRNSYSSSGRSFACQPFNIRSLFDMIWEMSFRLANVIIEQQSFEVLIPHYDRVDSLDCMGDICVLGYCLMLLPRYASRREVLRLQKSCI